MGQRYTVQTIIPTLNAAVGWDRDTASYWFVFWFDRKDPQTNAEAYGGDEDSQISDVGSLVRHTWGTVDWPNELGVLRMLRDDPWLDSVTEYGRTPGFADLMIAAFDPVALAAAAEDEVRRLNRPAESVTGAHRKPS